MERQRKMFKIRVLMTAMSVAAVAMFPASAVQAERTVGILTHDSAAQVGYTLFAPMNSYTTYLIDNDGRVINQWESDFLPGVSVYLQEDGSLLRTGQASGNSDFVAGGQGGQVERFNWNGTLEWSFRYSEEGQYKAHHDVEPLPNGNVLILAWEMRTEEQCIAAGREPGTMQDGELWPERVIEVAPDGFDSGEIVWEWNTWDHLIQNYNATLPNYGEPSDYPGRMHINYDTGLNDGDWLHANALHYNPDLDQIMINMHRLGEFWIIDHATTTEEAAGPAGDILYRWGNPNVYSRFAEPEDRVFWGQHDARWIPEGYPGAGNILVFNNGRNRPDGAYTTVEEIVPPLLADGTYDLDSSGIYGPAASEIVYIADLPTDFYAPFISGAERQPNGNTLICSGPWGEFFEVTPSGETVWFYHNPVTSNGILSQGELPDMQGGMSTNNRTFRSSRYGVDFPGFVGKDMTPGLPIEIYNGPCLPDLDGDGLVAVDDLLAVINSWGTGAGDVQGDGQTNVDDILQVVDQWGLCD
ncbi:MAG: arylsulfotransferase (ASST) [Phycisphaerae bacterium]|nr:arylsulfotransferase (ASST) [Phycisphaerae bacterium]